MEKKINWRIAAVFALAGATLFPLTACASGTPPITPSTAAESNPDRDAKLDPTSRFQASEAMSRICVFNKSFSPVSLAFSATKEGRGSYYDLMPGRSLCSTLVSDHPLVVIRPDSNNLDDTDIISVMDVNADSSVDVHVMAELFRVQESAKFFNGDRFYFGKSGGLVLTRQDDGDVPVINVNLAVTYGVTVAG